MLQAFTIPCELTIVPGGQTVQTKVTLRANGETVFDEYEQDLTDGQKQVAKQVAEAQAKLLTKWAAS